MIVFSNAVEGRGGRALLTSRDGRALDTARLQLVACSLDVARCSLDERSELAALLGYRVPDTWPPVELVAALALYARRLSTDPSELGWGVWLVLSPSEGTLVGSAGFKGKPDRSGCVEIGYGIEAPFRGRGYAREAVEGLVRWAWQQRVERIVAECHEANVASIRVLEGIGMDGMAPRGRMLWWELCKPS